MPKEVVPFYLRDGSEKELKKRKTNQRKPKEHERRVATEVGGRKQRGSGAFDDKGDVTRADRSFPLLVECKRTSGQKTLRLESDWLAKITREAHAINAYPALSIQFDEEIVRVLPGAPEATWVALPLSVLRGLLEKAGEDVDV